MVVLLGCYECHGYEGQGGGGPRLAPDPLPLEVFVAITRKPPNVMPSYSPNVRSDEQLERIYDYVESIPPPPDLSSIPLLAEE
jgi:mono/diheme cytochrome c family protein